MLGLTKDTAWLKDCTRGVCVAERKQMYLRSCSGAGTEDSSKKLDKEFCSNANVIKVHFLMLRF
jgi:hypothetical protein